MQTMKSHGNKQQQHEMVNLFWQWLKQLPDLTGKHEEDVSIWKTIGSLANDAWKKSGQSDMLLAWMDAHMEYIEKEARDGKQSDSQKVGAG